MFGSQPLATRPPAGQRRPRIAIVLGAGAARGWAQIGVMRALKAADFPIDMVVGTSIGAVVGGCFCAGKLDQLAEFATSLTPRRVFGLIDLSLSGGGLIGGNRLRERLEAELAGLRVEGLPIPFAACATEVPSGRETWLTTGDLTTAIRASYALPGVFEPVYFMGRWMVDGALVNPIPVTLARAMGADRVIAINMTVDALVRGPATPDETAPPPPPERARGFWPWRADRSTVTPGPSLAAVLADAFNITQDRIARSHLAGDPPDAMITVRMGGFSLFDFLRAAEMIAVGEKAVRRAMPDLIEQFPEGADAG
ncbi:MAG: patatin-like phospholipase family protein [Hyphomicrobiales bacterium]|nr:patatin-like phospholipase family protein [Hyphomicrobiales bacterium]